MVALISFWMIVNIFFVQFLSPVNISSKHQFFKSHMVTNKLVIYVHVGGFLACIITLLVCTKQKNSAAFVFTTFTNETGWGNGVAWCVGQLSALFAFFSLDSATHFSEEVPRREITVPRVSE